MPTNIVSAQRYFRTVCALTCNRLQGNMVIGEPWVGLNVNASDNHLKSAQWTAGTADVQVFKDRSAMGDAAAIAIADLIRRVAQAKGDVRMIFAAAPSQLDVLNALIEMPNIPWQQVTAFHMDDYVGLPIDAPERFASWLKRHLFSKVPIGTVHYIPSAEDAEAVCRAYSVKLAEAPIDIVCLGIGVNGHIAFNDPPVADFNDSLAVKVVELDQICRQQQVDDDCFPGIEDVPSHAITLTVPRLLEADALICVVPGAHKRPAVKASLEGPITTDCPASILRTHPNCTLYLDSESDPND